MVHVDQINKSGFILRDPKTGMLKEIPDRDGYINMFKLSNKKDNLVWHSIYSNNNRFSLGLHFKEKFIRKIINYWIMYKLIYLKIKYLD